MKDLFVKRKQKKAERVQAWFVQEAQKQFDQLKQEADHAEGEVSPGVANDFGRGFLFTDPHGTSASILLELLHDEQATLGARPRRIYSNQYFPYIMRISHKVPTFDEYDRQYDSKRSLVFFRQGDATYAVSYSEGYEMGSVYWLGRVTACPPELAKRLHLN